jgi:hypothetical protein
MSVTKLLQRLSLVSVCSGFANFPVAQAGVDSTGVPAPIKEEKNSSVREPVYQIRCWQEGKLLFEESDWVLTPEQARQIMIKAKKQKADTSVMVIELRNSLCLIKQVH